MRIINQESAMETQNGNSNDERLRILRMVEEGKISASEGISLLDAIEKGRKAGKSPNRLPASTGAGREAGAARWFRVQVTDLFTGRSKATVNIPMGLMDWGLRIGAQFAPEVSNYNLDELSRILREEGMGGKIIDVVDDEDGEHVEIFVD
jgi:hypothetical protein